MSDQSPVILGADGAPVPLAARQAAQRMAQMNHWRASAAYQAARYDHASTQNWHASGLSGHAAASQSRAVLNARVRDLVRNDSNMAAGLERKVNNVVGAGLQLSAEPDYDFIGIAVEDRERISDQIEALWSQFTDEQGCWFDAERHGNLADMLLVQCHHMETEGEFFAILPWRDEPAPTGFQTCVQIVHPSRCSNPMGMPDGPTLRDGVEIDGMGAAIGYHFRRAHPGDQFVSSAQFQWDFFARDLADAGGRPYVLHGYNRNEAGLYRAVSNLWSVLRKQYQGEKYFDTELQAAQLNATMALFIETPLDMFDAAESLSPETVAGQQQFAGEYHSANPVTFDGAQINILASGEKAHLTKPEHPNAAFDPFMKNVLRALASIIGVTYEQLTMDWSEVNYSSARAAILEVAKGFKVALGRLKSRFLKPLYWAFLQEIFDKGMIEVPAGALSFDQAPDAWAGCSFIGAGKGYVDPLKEVQAAGLRIVMGLSTLKQECAEQGQDYKKLILQTAKEIRMMREEAEKSGLDPNMIWHPAWSGAPSASSLTKSVASNAPDQETEETPQQAKAIRLSRSGVPLIKT